MLSVYESGDCFHLAAAGFVLCSWMQEADFEGEAPVTSSAGEVSHLVRGVVQISESPKACTALTGHKDPEAGDFAEACWLLE